MSNRYGSVPANRGRRIEHDQVTDLGKKRKYNEIREPEDHTDDNAKLKAKARKLNDGELKRH